MNRNGWSCTITDQYSRLTKLTLDGKDCRLIYVKTEFDGNDETISFRIKEEYAE